MPKGVFLTDSRDMGILQFLWRWKVVTTATLAAKFFPNAKPSVAYRRLWLLEKGHFIRSVTLDEQMHFGWTLDKRGFQVLSTRLYDLREAGYKSENLEHDHLVSAVHLGEWLRTMPEGSEVFSEQELRRLHLEHYPKWVPQNLAHRPDGYWCVADRGVKRTVALEVELSVQKRAKYDAIGLFYDSQRLVHRVLWVVGTPATAQMIGTSVQARSGGVDFHDFTLVSDIQRNGWGAKIIRGPEMGLTVASLLGISPTEVAQSSVTLLNFDFRKTGDYSGACASAETSTILV